MTAAGVQNIDSAAYVPSPPAASTPDAKGTSAAGKPVAGAQAASDFQSELELQRSGTQQTGGKAGLLNKAGSGKSGKKGNSRQEDDPAAVTPVSVTEPQRQILPLALVLARTQENAEPGGKSKSDAKDKAEQRTSTSEPPEAPQPVVQTLSPSVTADAQPVESPQPAMPEKSAKLRQYATSVEALPLVVANVAGSATPDSSSTQARRTQARPFAAFSSSETSVRQATATKSENSSSQDPAEDQNQDQARNQVSTSAMPGAPAESRSPSPVELNLPAVSPAPVATAVQKTDPAPSGPSTLAFAARMSTAALKADQAIAAHAASTPAVPGSQTPAQIPVRYAPTAQIIQSTAAGTKEDGSKKDPGAPLDAAVRTDARTDSRTDIVAPRIETASQPSSPSTPAPPPPPAPSAQMERIIETPAAPAASNRDIRVRVPDNSGGSTQVRFVESGGEVRVSVRTADEGLAQNLRTHLNDLTQRLSEGGVSAEIWKPAPSAASSQNNQSQSQQDGRGSGGQGAGGQGGQQDRQQKRPAWLDEMEASLHGEQH